MWPFVAGANSNFERFPRLHGVDAARRKHAPMEEGVAGPIREFDESKSLFRVEPLHDCSDWRAGGCLESGFTEAGSSSEGTGRRVVGFNVEAPTPRITEILMSHFAS